MCLCVCVLVFKNACLEECLRFEVLTVVTMLIVAFWVVLLCSLIGVISILEECSSSKIMRCHYLEDHSRH
jgi:hypothetical protein